MPGVHKEVSLGLGREVLSGAGVSSSGTGCGASSPHLQRELWRLN